MGEVKGQLTVLDTHNHFSRPALACTSVIPTGLPLIHADIEITLYYENEKGIMHPYILHSFLLYNWSTRDILLGRYKCIHPWPTDGSREIAFDPILYMVQYTHLLFVGTWTRRSQPPPWCLHHASITTSLALSYLSADAMPTLTICIQEEPF
jgi:hypothetical protein